MPEFADILEQVVTQSANQTYSHRALQILWQDFRERARMLIPRLIADDPSWATQPTVYEFLHRHRQDLLTPFLGQTAYKGRFSTGKTRFVLPLERGFERWTPTQQAFFAQTLADVGNDSERDTPTIMRSIRQLAGLMYVPPAHLLKFIEDKRLPVRDTALRVLGRLDGSEGVRALLDVMGDDRARIAIYALRHALLQMPPDQMLALLDTMPLNRVTVAKEVVRLIGEMNTEAAYHKLHELAQQDLHRDVRVALLRAFWTHLHRDETWPILMDAAVSTDSAVASMAGRTMAPARSAQVERRLIGLLSLVLQHPDPQVRLDVLNRIATHTVHDADQALAQPLLERLRSPLSDEVRAAATAFGTYVQQRAALVSSLIKEMLPQRRTLSILISALSARLWPGNPTSIEVAQAILAELAKDPMTVTLRLDVAGRVFSLAEFAALIQQLVDANQLHAEALVRTIHAINSHRGLGTEGAAVVEQAWRTHSSPLLRRLGLAVLIGNTKQPFGWTAARRAVLDQYRQDRDPLVASIAQFTFPPDEMETGDSTR